MSGIVPGVPVDSPAVQVAATTELQDRGYGRASFHLHSEQNINVLHLLAATALGAELVTDATAVSLMANGHAEPGAPVE